MPKLIVQKYGGTSLATNERIFNVASRIIKTKQSCDKIAAVVSAMGSTTDRLLETAYSINPSAHKREVDMLLATGEQQSAALLAMALQALGQNAVALCGVGTGIVTTDTHMSAKILRIEPEKITKLLDKNIVIIAGFQGITDEGDITTLGRGASDTTAVALAVALGADFCENCTDVDGIYTADPRLISDAIKLRHISFDQMLALAASGAKLHRRAVEMAERYNVKIHVRSSHKETEGTWIGGDDVEEMVVTGIAIDRNVARVSILGLEDKPGVAFGIFSMLAQAKISVDTLAHTVSSDTACDMCFTINKTDLNAVCDIMGAMPIHIDEHLARLSIVGAGLSSNPGILVDIFEAIYENNINIMMISTSEKKVSLLVDERHVVAAANAVHKKLYDAFTEVIKCQSNVLRLL